MLERGLDVARRDDARCKGKPGLTGRREDARVHARRDSKRRARFDHLLHLVRREDGADPGEHFRHIGADGLEGVERSRRAQREFHHIHAAGEQRFGERNGILCAINDEHGDNAAGFYALGEGGIEGGDIGKA